MYLLKKYIVETCASTQNVYNQNVKKSINTYVLQSLQIVIQNKRPNPCKSIINRLDINEKILCIDELKKIHSLSCNELFITIHKMHYLKLMLPHNDFPSHWLASLRVFSKVSIRMSTWRLSKMRVGLNLIDLSPQAPACSPTNSIVTIGLMGLGVRILFKIHKNKMFIDKIKIYSS